MYPEDLSDLSLISGDNIVFKVHKVVLISSC